MLEKISLQTLQRLPVYLELLRQDAASDNISANRIAEELGLTEIQVRKDLAAVSDAGRPKKGFVVTDLIADLERALGYDNADDAVLVGAGRLGRALLSYAGFQRYGLNIVAGFDTNPRAWGQDEVSGKMIYAMDKLDDLCRRLSVHMGIITVPAPVAQCVCDELVGAGAAVAPQSRAQTPDAAGEAIEALMALGYQSSEAARAVSSLSPLPDTADEIIRQALKSML